MTLLTIPLPKVQAARGSSCIDGEHRLAEFPVVTGGDVGVFLFAFHKNDFHFNCRISLILSTCQKFRLEKITLFEAL